MINIPDVRLSYIKKKVDEIINELELRNYPINMLDLFNEYYSHKYIIHYTEFSEKAEVVTNYYPAYDECVIIINEKFRQPKLLRRLNFSLAHEFGHIVLDHYMRVQPTGLIPYYEKEADEFAGQFLMPESEINYMPKDLKMLSEYFYVSEAAAKFRLHKLGEMKAKKFNKVQQSTDMNSIILRRLESIYYEP